jgi:hypothetical protein
LSLAGDIAARFEAGVDSSVGGDTEHPLHSQGSWGPAADCQPLAASLGLKDRPRPGKQPIYTKTTDKRILRLLDKPPPEGFARWTGSLLAEALGDVDVQYVWRLLRGHRIDLAVRKSWYESNDPDRAD